MTGEPFGTTSAGEPARLYTLDNRQGVVATLTDYGATLVQLHTPDRNGALDDVVLGFDSVEGYQSPENPYFGATVGRVANRIAYGTFTLDGQEHKLAQNEPPHHLHGGAERSFDKVRWRTIHADERTVEMRYVSPAGEEGYPGQVEASAIYRLTDEALVIEYRAATDAVTPLNMTNHAYFNLAGAGSGTILDHELQILADHYTEVDDQLIPTGETTGLSGTALDFRERTRIGERIGELLEVPGALGYDHNWVLRGEPGQRRLAAVLRDPASGRVMELSTDQPCLQFYSGNRLDDRIVGKQGQPYGLHGALCLEPQHAPDSVHHPQFPTVLLEPGRLYTHVSEYRFRTE